MTTNPRKPLPRLHTGTAEQLRPGDTLLTKGPALILDVAYVGDDVVRLSTLSHGAMTFHADDAVTWFRTAR